MPKQIELKLSPADSYNDAAIRSASAILCSIEESEITKIRLIKRSVDARSRTPIVILLVEVFINETPPPENTISFAPVSPKRNRKVIIVGAGPAGYFAALELLAFGLTPIVFERGKDVRSRRRDLRAIQQFGEVNPHSNYCFGEGGAGTYSDGKLYTSSSKRGNINHVLQILVQHGAPPDILVDAHPHIGSNKLPVVVQNIRQTILEHGGEIHFDSFVTDFILDEKSMKGVIVNESHEHFADAVILATGHSARDIFHLLERRKVIIEPKPFALGVRVEHPQALIDEIQYRQRVRDEFLPAASYKLVCQVKERGVFSFCMCPGGLIVPAATAPGEIVVNGMSMSRRDSPFANSGVVVAVEPEDLVPFKKYGTLAGLEFQKSVEQKVFRAGNGSQQAPAQRLTDFTTNKISSALPQTSYIPGIYSANLIELLPTALASRLQIAFKEFNVKMKGYLTNEAIAVATESRTSSPVKIPRNKDTFKHIEIENLYPCGEGAGYAGGIMSAALDGQNVARAVAGVLK
ncbi:MAG: FAD-binding protein [Ignavibacteriae bacterium]|nr:FAD-binding protein [Ignavibacteriota bacterium]